MGRTLDLARVFVGDRHCEDDDRRSDAHSLVDPLELVERVAPPHVAVRAAKIALLRGFSVEAYAFPTLLPKFDAAGGNGKIEAALLNALTRQESEFDPQAASGAGARGLMQLMPATAKMVAKQHGLNYSNKSELFSPTTNMQLGMAHFSDLLQSFSGSYVLAIASYNAGAGRINQWLSQYGDPRTGTDEMVDWIERIPFNETRNYVQRVLENLQVYRIRLGDHALAFSLASDLRR